MLACLVFCDFLRHHLECLLPACLLACSSTRACVVPVSYIVLASVCLPLCLFACLSVELANLVASQRLAVQHEYALTYVSDKGNINGVHLNDSVIGLTDNRAFVGCPQVFCIKIPKALGSRPLGPRPPGSRPQALGPSFLPKASQALGPQAAQAPGPSGPRLWQTPRGLSEKKKLRTSCPVYRFYQKPTQNQYTGQKNIRGEKIRFFLSCFYTIMVYGTK